VIGVLPHWHVLLAPYGVATTVTTITLADVQRVKIAMQQQFDTTASLEANMQTLVVVQLREQTEQQRARRQN
jgi:hypothetical protein